MECAVSTVSDLLGRAGCQPAVELSLPAQRESLSLIRDTFDSFLRKQLEQRSEFHLDLGEINLAVQEACTNVVRHAYPPGGEGRLLVRAECGLYLLRIAVVDEGRGYDPDAIPSPDPWEPREGGFGLHLIRTTMSKVSYHRRDNQNILLMEKSLLCAHLGDPR
jgi:serine/threonine-protein kinase RsbW